MIRIFIIISIILSICLGFVQPQMHKQIMVFDSDYKLVLPTDDNALADNSNNIAQIEKKEIEVSKPVVKTEFVEQKTQLKPLVEQKKVEYKTAKKDIVKVEKISKAPTVSKQVKKVETVPKTQQIVKTIQTVKEEPVKREQIKHEPVVRKNIVQPQKTVKVQQEQKSGSYVIPKYDPAKTAAQKAKEEEIAWNIWRSKLQNQIMSDARMPNIPNGIVFKFTFTVDKYGKISDIQTWSTTPAYTPHAIQYIAPVIRSYQGRSILNFPAGSNRVTTTVYGAWRIASAARYSTPQDFNDTEKISK